MKLVQGLIEDTDGREHFLKVELLLDFVFNAVKHKYQVLDICMCFVKAVNQTVVS